MNASPYEVLGVDRSANAEQIKRAYRVACKKHHPDRAQGDPERMLAVREAYDVLSDDERRARYDATGETKRRTPIDELAQQVLLGVFVEFLKKADDYFDPVPGITKGLEKALQDQHEALKKLDKQLEHIAKRAKQIRRKDGGEDLFASLIEQETRNTKATITNTEAMIQAIPRAIAMLKEYESEPAKAREKFTTLLYGTTSTASTWGDE